MTVQEQACSKYVIDTNVIVYTMQGIPEAVSFMEMVGANQSQILYSVIVEAELFSSHLLTKEDKTDLRKLLNMGEL